MKPLIFMSGQVITTMLLAMKEDWGFTRNSRKASSIEKDGFRLDSMPFVWKGVIYYAADPDSENAKKNLQVFSNVPCWPDPQALLRMVDRHEVAHECFMHGFYVNDPLEVVSWQMCEDIYGVAPVNTVVKYGNEHSGEGKILVAAGDSFPKWEGPATIQPFFNGKSVRILHIGAAVFFIETVHEESWIKNSPGGENILLDSQRISSEMLDHSGKVRDHFGLDVCGNDYILEDDGTFHFLETNQFPGLGDDFLGDLPRDFFLEKMRSLEKIVGK